MTFQPGDLVQPTRAAVLKWANSTVFPQPYHEWRAVVQAPGNVAVPPDEVAVRWTHCPMHGGGAHYAQGATEVWPEDTFELADPIARAQRALGAGVATTFDRSGHVSAGPNLAPAPRSYRYACDTCFGTGEVAVCVPCPKGCVRHG